MKIAHGLPLVVFAFSLLMPGCLSGPAEMHQILGAMDKQDPRDHETIMRTFIAKAQLADIDGMVALMSKITLKTAGGEEKERDRRARKY